MTIYKTCDGALHAGLIFEKIKNSQHKDVIFNDLLTIA
jgi:hypothetical protein